MKKILIVLFAAVFAISANAQEKPQKDKGRFFKSIYNELFKYGTFYVAGDIQNPKENPKDYFVRTNPSGNLYEPPVVVDGTDVDHNFITPFISNFSSGGLTPIPTLSLK